MVVVEVVGAKSTGGIEKKEKGWWLGFGFCSSLVGSLVCVLRTLLPCIVLRSFRSIREMFR